MALRVRMSADRLVAALVLVGTIAACERSEPVPGQQRVAELPADVAAAPATDLAADEVRTVQEYLDGARFAAADRKRGQILSLACQACHTLRAGEDHHLGPNLYGVFGRRAGSGEGFPYSDALRSSGLVWTPQVLEAWLVEPADFIPGNNMAFAGFRRESDRRDLLAYLLAATSGLDP